MVQNGARMIDIRGRDEFARSRAVGAKNVPVEEIESLEAGGPVVFLCRSGMRTVTNAAKLGAACGGEAYILDGGLDAWRAAGLATEDDRSQPLEIMRQVQIVAGSLVLIGVVLGFLVTPLLFGLSAFVGAGLVMAGVTGWCGMAQLLRGMPWNRRAA